MTRYRYCMNTAFDAGEKRHPQTVIEEWFPEATELEPVSIADCWLFESGNVRAKAPLPDYFIELTSDPQREITWIDEVAAGPTRMLVPDGDGMREETDDELRARITAKLTP
jgi:hypothetical protein